MKNHENLREKSPESPPVFCIPMMLGFIAFGSSVLYCREYTTSEVCRTSRTRMSVKALSDSHIFNAIRATDEIFGDNEDEYMHYHRWCKAQEAVARSDLKNEMDADALVYGEFDLQFFGKALKIACELLPGRAPAESHCARPRFVDIGSGLGRIVQAASLMLPQWDCIGIEIVPDLVRAAEEMCEIGHGIGMANSARKGSRKFIHGDYSDPSCDVKDALQGAEIVFCFATTWPSAGTPYLNTLTAVLGQLVSPQAVVMTVDKQLASDELDESKRKFVLRTQFDGANLATGQSTLYMYQLTT